MPDDVRTTVLVVDDDAEFVTDFALALVASGYRVLKAADAQSAYKAMDGPKRVDLMVVDLVLPDRSGLEVILEARRHHPDIKVLATTDIQGPLHLEIATYMGADAAIHKFHSSAIGHFPAAEWVSQINKLSHN